MDQAAEGSPRFTRIVRCPECKTVLLQPAGSTIFQCSVCSIFLQAKGSRSWQISLNENGQGIEVNQEIKELEAKSVSGSEVSRAQGQDELDNHEVNAERSMNGHQEEVLIPVTNESVFEKEMEQELQLQSDVVNGSTSGVGDLDTTSDYAIRRSNTIVKEGMAMEMQHSLDSVSEEGPSASISGKPQAAHDHMNIQEIVSNGVEQTVVQSPLEDAQNCNLSSASRVENAFVGECEAMEGKKHTECDTSADGNVLVAECEGMKRNNHKECETSANGNVLVAECEGMKRNNHKECDTSDVGNVFVGEGDGVEHKRCGTSADEKVFVDEREGVEGKNHKECDTLVDGNLYVGDGEGVEGAEGKNHKGCGSLNDGNVLVGECEGVEGKNHKECDNVADGNDRAFESEIIRDELSFKYIAALESEESNKPLHAHFPRQFPFSSDENSDESESYSSVSDLASHDGLDSDFDFPAQLAENMLPAKLTDSFLLQKMPSPSDVPEPPHQLEWQDVYYDKEESTFQDSNGAIVSSVGVVDKVASDALTMVEQGDQVEIAEVGPHIEKENLMKRKTVLQGHGDRVATISETSHAQRDKGYSGLGGLANTVGFVASEGGVKNMALNDTAGTENGYPGTLSYQLNECKPFLSNDSRDEVSKSQEVLSSAAGHPLKLKPRCTLNEGNLNTNTLCLGTEASTSSLSGGSKEETCLAVQENIQLIESVAIISPKDSAATSSSGYTGNDIGNQSKIASHIISIQKTWEKPSDLLHPVHDMLMTIANNQTGRSAPHSDYASKRDVRNVDLAKVPESAGMQPSLSIEQGNLSSHSAVNIFESRPHSIRNCSFEETQVHNRENALSVKDSQLHHKRNFPLEERQMLNVKGSKHASQVQQSIHNEGLDVPRATRTLEGAPKTRQRLVQADCGIADGQGPLPQKHNWQADVHMMEQTRNHPGHVKDVHGHSPVTSQPFGYTNYYTKSDVFARGVPSANTAYSYQAPSHPLMVPIAMQGHGCSHYGCHPVPPVCMACIHCQHSHSRQPMLPCGLCLNQSLLMAYQQGHPEFWNYHHIHQVQGPDEGVSVVDCPPTCISSQTVHMHGTATAAAKPLVSSVRKPKHYPPLPQGSVAPYVMCKCCDEIMQVPADLPLSDQVVQKLRCGACHTVSKFSVLKGTQETSLPRNVGLQSSAVKSTSAASTSFSPSAQYTNKDSRQLPVSTVTQIMESSYHQALYSKHPQAAVNSQLQNGGGVVPASMNRRFSEDEIVFKNQSKQVVPDTEITPAITDHHSSQDEFFFRSLSRQCEFDSSRNWFKTSSSVMGTIECTEEALIVGNDPSLQASVDEKEEGLDFGAPRMSDGESLGQRSPESRKVSLESKRDFRVMEQNRYREGSFGGEASWMTDNMQHEVVELKQDDIAQKGKSRASLIALLSQESTKFELNIEERVSFDESRSALWSTATNSPVCEDHTDQGFHKRDADIGQRRNLTAHHFVRKGPRYIAGMLRRSLKDFHKGIQ